MKKNLGRSNWQNRRNINFTKKEVTIFFQGYPLENHQDNEYFVIRYRRSLFLIKQIIPHEHFLSFAF